MIDKQKHAHEFRLRILVTNECDKACDNCLNDFLEKPGEQLRGIATYGVTAMTSVLYIGPEVVYEAIDNYMAFCYVQRLTPIISFSGGEPALHPLLHQFLFHALSHDSGKVQLNTGDFNFPLGLYSEYAERMDIRYHVTDYENTTGPFWFNVSSATLCIIILH